MSCCCWLLLLAAAALLALLALRALRVFFLACFPSLLSCAALCLLLPPSL